LGKFRVGVNVNNQCAAFDEWAGSDFNFGYIWGTGYSTIPTVTFLKSPYTLND
jgi:hypothetical protein